MIGKRLDQFVLAQVGVPHDLGWAIATLNADSTVTRVCKGCGVSVTTFRDPETGKVGQAAIHHATGCAVFDHLGNNPKLS